METISDLRKICQSTRPAIYGDFLSRWYYRLSIYFTWLCLKLGLSANQVTVLSGAVAILGGILLVSDSKIVVILGVLCFHLFAILDMSDGEVARYRKQGGVAGHYLDWYMHFVSSTALVVGLFLASLNEIKSIWLVGIGLLAVVTPILAKSVQNAGWTVICWTRLRDIQKNNDDACQDIPTERNDSSPAIPQSFIYRRFRFLLLSPLQDHWLPTILLLIAGLDLVLSLIGIAFIDYRTLLVLYIGVVGPVHIYMTVRNMIMTDSLMDGYRRLVCPNRQIKLPEDDFL